MELQIGGQTITVEEEICTNIDMQNMDYNTTGNQYLTFILGEEHYGVDILNVKEIRGWEQPTLIPHSADYVKGVINMRGVIVPILDLRIRFDIGELIYDATTVVIVLSTNIGDRNCTMGFVVDAVSDVLSAEQHDISPAPPFYSSISPEYIAGLVNVGSNVVTLIHIEQILCLEDEGVTSV